MAVASAAREPGSPGCCAAAAGPPRGPAWRWRGELGAGRGSAAAGGATGESEGDEQRGRWVGVDFEE